MAMPQSYHQAHPNKRGCRPRNDGGGGSKENNGESTSSILERLDVRAFAHLRLYQHQHRHRGGCQGAGKQFRPMVVVIQYQHQGVALSCTRRGCGSSCTRGQQVNRWWYFYASGFGPHLVWCYGARSQHNTTTDVHSIPAAHHDREWGGACVMALVGCTSDGGGCLVCRAPGVAPNLVHLHQHHRINTTATIGTAEECGKEQYRQVYVLAIVRLPRRLCV